jgi:hypothetical protein
MIRERLWAQPLMSQLTNLDMLLDHIGGTEINAIDVLTSMMNASKDLQQCWIHLNRVRWAASLSDADNDDSSLPMVNQHDRSMVCMLPSMTDLSLVIGDLPLSIVHAPRLQSLYWTTASLLDLTTAATSAAQSLTSLEWDCSQSLPSSSSTTITVPSLVLPSLPVLQRLVTTVQPSMAPLLCQTWPTLTSLTIVFTHTDTTLTGPLLAQLVQSLPCLTDASFDIAYISSIADSLLSTTRTSAIPSVPLIRHTSLQSLRIRPEVSRNWKCYEDFQHLMDLPSLTSCNIAHTVVPMSFLLRCVSLRTLWLSSITLLPASSVPSLGHWKDLKRLHVHPPNPSLSSIFVNASAQRITIT